MPCLAAKPPRTAMTWKPASLLGSMMACFQGCPCARRRSRGNDGEQRRNDGDTRRPRYSRGLAVGHRALPLSLGLPRTSIGRAARALQRRAVMP